MRFAKLSLFLLVVMSLFNSCLSDWNVNELYRQKIEGTSKVLYKYSASGGRDSMTSGYILMDSTEVFKVDLDKDLDLYLLSEIPTKQTIKGVTHECANSCDKDYKAAKPIFTPIKSEKNKFGNIDILTYVYQYKGFAERERSLQTFEFKRFKETKDSIYFYNLHDVESMDGKHLDSLKFKKTTVIIQQNNNLEVKRIVLENLILSNTGEIQLLQKYFLTPNEKIKTDSFSDRGIFKEVIK